jgi:hypothetical protein
MQEAWAPSVPSKNNCNTSCAQCRPSYAVSWGGARWKLRRSMNCFAVWSRLDPSVFSISPKTDRYD